MIFRTPDAIKKEGCFRFGAKASAVAHFCLDKEVIKDFWKGHTYFMGEISFEVTDELCFVMGNAEKLPLDGKLYAINVEKTGIAITADSEKGLINGVMTLFDRIRGVDFSDSPVFEVDCFELKESPVVENRFVHYCIFPGSDLFSLRKFIRLCGAVKYSHIILEFWGTLKLDALSELAWKDLSFTKEEIKPLIEEARDLGMEVVPMINHWGHASSARYMHGKHVVLDQNPRLQYLFREDGWCWDISKKEVRELLAKVREELMELCGEGKYFNIGCDEAYNFEFTEENAAFICGYLNEIAEQLESCGRRAIVWGDMFVSHREEGMDKKMYFCGCPGVHMEKKLHSMLSKKLIIGDWQYSATDIPFVTLVIFKESGFDVILCT